MGRLDTLFGKRSPIAGTAMIRTNGSKAAARVSGKGLSFNPADIAEVATREGANFGNSQKRPNSTITLRAGKKDLHGAFAGATILALDADSDAQADALIAPFMEPETAE